METTEKTETKDETIERITKSYQDCMEITAGDALKNAEHVYEFVLAVDEGGTIRRKENHLAFFWLEYDVYDRPQFDKLVAYMTENDGESPAWSETEGTGCNVKMLPYLKKGEDRKDLFYVPVVMEGTGFKNGEGKEALNQLRIVDYEDKSGLYT